MVNHSVVLLRNEAQILDFESSSPELTEYLVEDAIRDQAQLVATTHLLIDDSGYTIGYLTLVNDSIKVSTLSRSEIMDDYHYTSIPALKIGRLSCRRGYEGQGLGTEMIKLALSYLFEILKYSGCRILTVDSKRGCEGFYGVFGFKKTTSNKNHCTPMYLDVSVFISSTKGLLGDASFRISVR